MIPKILYLEAASYQWLYLHADSYVKNVSPIAIELARDALHKTDKFHVVGGIISPVNDDYKKEVKSVFFLNL